VHRPIGCLKCTERRKEEVSSITEIRSAKGKRSAPRRTGKRDQFSGKGKTVTGEKEAEKDRLRCCSRKELHICGRQTPKGKGKAKERGPSSFEKEEATRLHGLPEKKIGIDDPQESKGPRPLCGKKGEDLGRPFQPGKGLLFYEEDFLQRTQSFEREDRGEGLVREGKKRKGS